jgi:hypothetical protein
MYFLQLFQENKYSQDAGENLAWIHDSLQSGRPLFLLTDSLRKKEVGSSGTAGAGGIENQGPGYAEGTGGE